MLTREVVDILIRSVSGGVNTIDSKYEPEYVEALLPQLREQAIKLDFFGSRDRAATRRLDYALTQSTNVTKNVTQNTSYDYITFTLPKPIALGYQNDGLVYVGQEDNSVSFSKFMNREDVANAKMRGMLNGEQIGYIHEGTKLLIFGNNMLSEVNVRGIFYDPLVVPEFNWQTDDYPVTESILSLMVELFKSSQNVNINKPADNILDNADTTSRGVIANNLKQ
jgi:hypothetical protein